MNEAPAQAKGAYKIWFMLFLVLCLGLAAIGLEHRYSQSELSFNFDLRFLPATIGAQCLFFWYATTLWRQFLHSTTHLSITASQSFTHITAVTIGKYLPGKFWGLVARGAQLDKEGLSIGTYTSVSFLEQYLLLLASGIIAALSGPLFIDSVYMLIPIVLLAPALYIAYRMQDYFYKLYNSFILRKESSPPQDRNAFRPMSLPEFMVYSARYLLLWVLNGMVLVSLLMLTSDIAIDPTTAMRIIGCNAIAVTIGFFALFAPGGIGVREAALTALIGPFIGISNAIQLALIYRLFTVASELLSGAISIVFVWKKST